MGRIVRIVVGVALALLASELVPDGSEAGSVSLYRYLMVAFHLGLLTLPLDSELVGDECQVLGDFMFAMPEGERHGVQHWAARLGGFSITTRAIRRHMRHMDNPEGLVACARWFCGIANFNREASLYVPSSGAIELLMELMDKFPYHAGLQAQAAASLGCWCDFTPETQAVVAEVGAPQAILRAIRTFPSSTEVQYLGWAGLSAVSNTLPVQNMVVDAGAVPLGMQTMRDPAVRTGHRVRQEVIMTFCNLAAGCNRCVNEMLASGDIIEQVIQAMEDDSDDFWAERGSKTNGIQLMMEFAADNRTTRRAILRSGFVNHTLRAMKKFPKHHPQNAWPLCEMGLRLMSSLAEEEEGREALRAAGVAEVVNMVLQAESTEERQTRGAKLLSQVFSP